MPNQLFFKLNQEKQDIIIKSALDEFIKYKDNYAKASVNRIAENANIAVGSLYKYFNGKDDLFFYVYSKYAKSFTLKANTTSLKTYYNSRHEIFSKMDNLSYIEERLIYIINHNDNLLYSLIFDSFINSNLFKNVQQALENDKKNNLLRDDINIELVAYLYHSIDLISNKFCNEKKIHPNKSSYITTQLMDIIFNGIYKK